MNKKRTEFHEVRHIQEPVYPWFEGEPKLEDGVLYVVDGPQYVEYNCPCGCGNTVMIPFYTEGKEISPAWSFREVDGKVTLSPSILSSGWPCKSHYFIQGNHIKWCG